MLRGNVSTIREQLRYGDQKRIARRTKKSYVLVRQVFSGIRYNRRIIQKAEEIINKRAS